MEFTSLSQEYALLTRRKIRPNRPPLAPKPAEELKPPEDWVRIEPGEFLMGSPESEAGRYSDEVQHRVVLTRPFLLQATPVMQGQFEELMGYNPSHFKGAGLRAPVETVSWYEAVTYCNALSDRAGLERAYVLSKVKGKPGETDYTFEVEWKGLDCPGYHLPTEAEWEYAARAGTTTATYNGDLSGDPFLCMPSTVLDPIAWYCGNSGHTTHEVGTRQANAWGLYDLLGNVWEWCHDWYKDYPGGPVTDPTGPVAGSLRVDRGGSWNFHARFIRAAFRGGNTPGGRFDSLGFRPSRSSP